ncbi:S9 family peptidase [Mycobacterium sp. SMC-4]|uniref:alpha/beta hydrolase family protein n=1 Tax=Mycobacterium sp. SMC-4 TaxID=2857059 RepID=UPI0021B29151|nr:CocE/NonD family hydrolase [Mycobacterium sp. SMC-4]UXA18760.1 peptidase S15 [Mycobacterium sp. SMC-4]
MGAGGYVGRVGGLAVALGIGVAVVAGAGAASAEESTSSARGTTGTAASTTSQTSSSTETADRPSRGAEAREARRAQRSETAQTDPTRSTRLAKAVDDAESVAKQDASAVEEKAAPQTPAQTSGTEPVPDLESAVGHVVEDVEADPVTPSAPEPAESAPQAAQEPELVESAAGDTATVETTTTTLGRTAPRRAAVDPGNPAVPGLASMMLSLVTAGREITAEAAQPAQAQVTSTALADADLPYPIPTDVKVTEVTAVFEWAQRIPVLGPLLVTPVVRFLHVIPFVGDILHPLIGWPIDHFADPDAPKPRTVLVESFDGAKIYVHFMPAKGLQAGQAAPTVFSGPGLGLPGATTLDLRVDSFLPNDVIGVGALREAGYNVVTWDPRGEWRSQGRMQLQSPDFEGRDISHIISWLATLPEVASDNGDPKIGMVGASYGGGIQLATAAIDPRIDAIVPTIAWNSLVDVLFPREAVRSGWATLLTSVLVLTLARPHERILPAAVVGILTGKASQSDIDLLNERGYTDRIDQITAPTLLIQGTVDTLFTLGQADLNAKALIDAGTTTKVLWYCGGHGACVSSYNNGDVVIGRTLDWLDRYVKGENVDTGPQFEWVDQRGQWFSSDTYPVDLDDTPLVAEGTQRQSMAFVPFIGGSGPDPWIITRGLIATILGLPSATYAFNAVNLRVPEVAEVTHVVGAPSLTLTYSGTGNAKHVYAQIVDNRTGLVLGHQVTPIPVQLDGESREITVSLEQIAHTLNPGQSVTVQVMTSAFNFLNFYSWGAITVESMSVRLPTLAAGTVAQVPAIAA